MKEDLPLICLSALQYYLYPPQLVLLPVHPLYFLPSLLDEVRKPIFEYDHGKKLLELDLKRKYVLLPSFKTENMLAYPSLISK